jgi:hypothetical protein
VNDLSAAAVRVEPTTDIARYGGLATAARVEPTANVTLTRDRGPATAARVGSTADIALARRGVVAAAVRVHDATDVTPQTGQPGPELAQDRGRGGSALLPRCSVTPRRGDQEGEDEQHGHAANEGSSHDRLLSGITAPLRPPLAQRRAPRYAYGACSSPGKVHTKGPRGDISPAGDR